MKDNQLGYLGKIVDDLGLQGSNVDTEGTKVSNQDLPHGTKDTQDKGRNNYNKFFYKDFIWNYTIGRSINVIRKVLNGDKSILGSAELNTRAMRCLYAVDCLVGMMPALEYATYDSTNLDFELQTRDHLCAGLIYYGKELSKVGIKTVEISYGYVYIRSIYALDDEKYKNIKVCDYIAILIEALTNGGITWLMSLVSDVLGVSVGEVQGAVESYKYDLTEEFRELKERKPRKFGYMYVFKNKEDFIRLMIDQPDGLCRYWIAPSLYLGCFSDSRYMERVGVEDAGLYLQKVCRVFDVLYSIIDYNLKSSIGEWIKLYVVREYVDSRVDLCANSSGIFANVYSIIKIKDDSESDWYSNVHFYDVEVVYVSGLSFFALESLIRSLSDSFMRESLTVDIGRFASRMAVVLELEKQYGKLADVGLLGIRDKSVVNFFKSILEKPSVIEQKDKIIKKRRTVGDAKNILLALGCTKSQVSKALRSFLGDKIWAVGNEIFNFIG